KFYGPTRLREALYRSQNLVSIRILNQVGPATAIRYISPFGFPRQKLNADLSLALGASAVTPLELATGYAVFANGGFSIEPYFIERIEDEYGTVLFQAAPRLGCEECENASRVIDKRTHFLMISMMRDVVRLGTGRRALVLN